MVIFFSQCSLNLGGLFLSRLIVVVSSQRANTLFCPPHW
jgi:hypothetical protein